MKNYTAPELVEIAIEACNAAKARGTEYFNNELGGEDRYACGFAWVNIPGNTAFGRWANKNKIARPAYPKGLTFWCPLMTQSMDIKEQWAWAFAKVLQQHGIEASASSRMD